MNAFWQDLRYAFRQLLQSPLFTALAVLSLALGIGANTAMFTVVEGVLLRPLPYPDSGRLVSIGGAGARDNPTDISGTSWLNYRDVREQARSLSEAACYSQDIGAVRTREGSLSVVTPGISPSLFRILGARPLLGRTFSEDEGKPGGPRVAMLSEGLWRQSFGADPGIIGQTIRVNGDARTVVGVLPRQFRFPESIGPDLAKGLWLPLQPTPEMLRDRGYHLFLILGQLKPGGTLTQFRQELNAISARIRQADTKANSDVLFAAASYQQQITGSVRPVLIGLVSALGLVLLIACANVANLLIARCLGRRHEFAVRSALGAGQWRLMRQLITEGALLSLGGCIAGFGLAAAALTMIGKLPPDTIPRSEDIGLRWTVVAALAVIAVLTTIFSSLLPALLAGRADPQRALQAASRGLGTRSVRTRISSYVVAAEVALSTLLLISTGLLFRTLWNLEHARLGFDVTRVTSFSAMPPDAAGFGNMGVSEPGSQPASHISTVVYQPALERLEAIPGFRNAALITAPPFSGVNLGSSFDVVGISKDQQQNYQTQVSAVSGSYAQVMSTPIIRGRMIDESDTETAPFVAVVNETFARKYFPGQNPVGKQINLGGKETGMLKPYAIAGVLGDQAGNSVSAPPKPLLLIPYRQIPASSLFYAALLKTVVSFVVKTRADIPVAPAAKAAFRQVAPEFALDNFQTMQEGLAKSNFNQRLGLYLIGAFGAMAVLMVIAGLYGVLAQMVGYRRREIGVRLALGATPPGILSMILRQASVLVLGGIVAGIALSAAATQLEQDFLYGVKPLDAWTYAAVVVLLLLIGAMAAFVPARRAAAVEPVEALREQ